MLMGLLMKVRILGFHTPGSSALIIHQVVHTEEQAWCGFRRKTSERLSDSSLALEGYPQMKAFLCGLVTGVELSLFVGTCRDLELKLGQSQIHQHLEL